MRLIDADNFKVSPKFLYDICGEIMIRAEDLARILNSQSTASLPEASVYEMVQNGWVTLQNEQCDQ